MLKFTGIGSAFNPELGNVNAYIKEKESLLLIDCGGTVFDRLLKNKMLDSVKNLYILITHTHPDHVGSLGDIVFYSYYVLRIKPTVIFPEKALITGLLRSMGVGREICSIMGEHSYNMNDSNLGKFNIKFMPVSHVDVIPSFSIEIKNEKTVVYYSGDSNAISGYVLEGLKNGSIDMMYQDTCQADYENNNHLSLRKLAELIEPGLRHKIYCMHLDKLFDVKLAENLGFNVVEIEENK